MDLDISVDLKIKMTGKSAEYLSHTAMKSFYQEQNERFSLLDGTIGGDRFENGTMFWCDNYANAILLKTYLETTGHKTVIFSDEDDEMDYCVTSTLPWSMYSNS